MGPVEICLIIGCVLVVAGVFGTWVYKKIKGLPTGECGCCQSKGNKMLKQYHKKYGKKNSACSCGCDNKQKDETSSCCCQTSIDDKKENK